MLRHGRRGVLARSGIWAQEAAVLQELLSCEALRGRWTDLKAKFGICPQRQGEVLLVVVIDVLEGYNSFPDLEFATHISTFAPLAVGLMNREMGPELQRAVQGFWQRVCEVKLDIEKMPDLPLPTPTSPRNTLFGQRKTSRPK